MTVTAPSDDVADVPARGASPDVKAPGGANNPPGAKGVPRRSTPRWRAARPDSHERLGGDDVLPLRADLTSQIRLRLTSSRPAAPGCPCVGRCGRPPRRARRPDVPVRRVK